MSCVPTAPHQWRRCFSGLWAAECTAEVLKYFAISNELKYVHYLGAWNVGHVHGQQWHGQWIAVKRQYHGSVELEGRKASKHSRNPSVYIYISTIGSPTATVRDTAVVVFACCWLYSAAIYYCHLRSTPRTWLPPSHIQRIAAAVVRPCEVGEKQATDRARWQVGLSITLKASMLCGACVAQEKWDARRRYVPSPPSPGNGLRARGDVGLQ